MFHKQKFGLTLRSLSNGSEGVFSRSVYEIRVSDGSVSSSYLCVLRLFKESVTERDI